MDGDEIVESAFAEHGLADCFGAKANAVAADRLDQAVSLSDANIKRSERLLDLQRKSAAQLRDKAVKRKLAKLGSETCCQVMTMLGTAFCKANQKERVNYGHDAKELLEFFSKMSGEMVRKMLKMA